MTRRIARTTATVAAMLAAVAFIGPADAQRLNNGKAVFAALDKVTARISRLEIKLGETKQFGALKLTPRACYSRPPTAAPKTTTFVEIDEVLLDGKSQRLFAGWMFAESPGLNAVEHPVYDVWLTDCSDPVGGPLAAQGTPGNAAAPAGEPPPPLPPTRRSRPRR